VRPHPRHLSLLARKDLTLPHSIPSAKRNGSISAEHGLGLMKANHVHYSKTEPAIALMQQIRRLFDPRGILNPGKYLPPVEHLPEEGQEKIK